MIVLISAVVALSAVVPSAASLVRVREILRSKTFDICRNLGNHISNVAREELLLDATYDSTRDAMRRLASSQDSEDRIPGLRRSYVVNFDGVIVSALQETRIGEHVSGEQLAAMRAIRRLTLSEEVVSEKRVEILRFAYPVFIRSHRGEEMRVGTTIFEFDRDEVYGPVTNLTTFVVMVTLILLVVGLGVGLVTALYFAKPIGVLTEGARMIGSGNLEHRIAVRRSDELGELANSFNRMTDEIQDFTRNLEGKVEERTRQLNQSLQEVQALKQQQDGDYFLTSLLLEPFRRNENDRADLATDFLIDQKKKFEFKEWTAEIGGDYCITDTITIGSRDYAVFLNADAMGKSIQGAGGALVLAAVFQAFLTRSRDPRYAVARPELWLRDCYMDLQKIFVTFRGSMFMTMVLGLADRQGVVYYVNTEHPPIVIYRAGRAEYAQQAMWLRKLGTPGAEDSFRVRVLQLEPEDVLYAGSDGKDDIVPNAEGRQLSDGRDWFLVHVEASRGRLEELYDLLRAHGEVKDDVSLLRLQYRPTADEAPATKTRAGPSVAELTKFSRGSRSAGGKEYVDEAVRLSAAAVWPEEFVEVARRAATELARARKYDQAHELFERTLDRRPAHGEVLMDLAELFLRQKQLDRALDFAEALRLRDPDDEPVLHLISEIYLKAGDYERAAPAIEKAIELDADNSRVRKLHGQLASRRPDLLDTSEQMPEVEMQRMLASVEKQYRSEHYMPAVALCRQILTLEPGQPRALARMGDSYLRDGKFERALPVYNRLLFAMPGLATVRNNLAVALAMVGRPKRARAHLERALGLQPDLAEAARNLERLSGLGDGDPPPPFEQFAVVDTQEQKTP